MKLALAPIVVCTLLSAPAGAQMRQDLVKAELLADVSAAKPGGTFTLGVLLTVEPGWHVYWLNPGDSGRATTVKFEMPNGFKVRPLRYPVPVKFVQPGDVVGYGYEQRVLLTAEVTVPADAAGGGEVAIGADVTWLCCKDVCIPGKAKLSISLPPSTQPARANEKVFDEWAPRFPVDKSDAAKLADWKVDGAAAGRFTRTIEWTGTPPQKVELYPGGDDALEIQSADVSTGAGRSVAVLKARVYPGQQPDTDTLPALLVYTDANGVRHGINVPVPLASLGARPAGKKD